LKELRHGPYKQLLPSPYLVSYQQWQSGIPILIIIDFAYMTDKQASVENAVRECACIVYRKANAVTAAGKEYVSTGGERTGAANAEGKGFVSMGNVGILAETAEAPGIVHN
jgi:hypothetical protein